MILWLSVATAHPSPKLSCDELAARLLVERLPARPTAPTWWWMEKRPCPGGILGGPVPPAAREVWCEDADHHRTGSSTSLSGDLKVLFETRFDRDQEVGPRVDWNPATQQSVGYTSYQNDLPHGLALEWTGAGTVVAWLRKGVKEGPTYKLDERGAIELIEFWDAGARTSRNCVWREGKLVIDTQ